MRAQRTTWQKRCLGQWPALHCNPLQGPPGKSMNERQLHGLIGRVRSGQLPRREFMQRMTALGVSAPLVSAMLAHHGVAHAQTPPFVYKGSKRGGGGVL